MDETKIMSLVAIIVAVGGTIVGIINHKRIRSSCCGKTMIASIDIEQTTPNIKPEIKIQA